MRGIGILLMLLGHIPVEGMAYKLIYSFHMPMFFLLAGYFTNSKALFTGGGYSQIAKISCRLLMPYVVTLGMIVMMQIGACLLQDKPIDVGRVMGPLWFLPAMWWAKVVVGSINKMPHYVLPVGMGVGLLACLIGLFWVESKVFVLQGICAVPLLCIGQYVRARKLPWWICLIGIVSWIGAILFSHMDMHQCKYGFYPLDILGACGGTLVLFYAVDRVCRWEWSRYITKPIALLGQFSLAALCMHGLEWKALLPLEQSICDGVALLVLRFSVTIVLTILVVNLPWIRKIYR